MSFLISPVDPALLDEDPVTKDWPVPSPQEPEKSLWARIWDAVREPFNFGGDL